jgi:hypothetical protein
MSCPPPDLEVERNATLQKIGRNVVNLQKLEAMLKYLLVVSDHTAPASTFSSELAKRKELIGRMPMGVLVEKATREVFERCPG